MNERLKGGVLLYICLSSMAFASSHKPVQEQNNISWINLCSGHNVQHKSRLVYPYIDPAGDGVTLSIDKQRLSGCAHATLTVNYAQIRWAHLIRTELVNRLNGGIILQGEQIDKIFSVSEIIVPPEKSPEDFEKSLYPYSMNRNLISELTYTPFGSEQRAYVNINDNSIELNCKAGNKHAGLKINRSGMRLPLGVYPTLKLQYRATRDFDLSISDTLRNKNENPLPVKVLEKANPLSPKNIIIPYHKIDTKTEIGWSLHCPTANAQLVLTSLKLEAEPSKNGLIKGIWVWDPNAWIKTPVQLLQKAKSINANEVYVSVPVNTRSGKIVKQNALTTFIGKASNEKIAIWIVEGDPHAVIKDQRSVFLRRAKIYSAYNSENKQESQIRGIQYDIEPYLMPAYSLDEARWIKAYSQTLTALSRATSLPIDIVIPFWWDNQQYNGEYFLNALTPYVERITVMNYRTDKKQLIKFAEPFLVWGQNHQRKVRIALELGRIEQEKRWHYQPSKSGRLWLHKVKDQHLLILLDSPAANPYGKQFKLLRNTTVSGNSTSFYSDQQSLFNILSELQAHWLSYHSFDGISLHGM